MVTVTVTVTVEISRRTDRDLFALRTSVRNNVVALANIDNSE